ncbi:transcriptional regulator [Sphingomonas sp. BAUL-RG-20F-R05-02]|uniref:transcriptional regulator n=1 Tax=Sphingomonas sp. BAUL-RG-20F-R05-02 TaxID=2914830 RepID=UPI001F578171|nr:YdaS family helix-turn-helix protein [Sphingomonas sp. BAUL-RG-20F-R05-02]
MSLEHDLESPLALAVRKAGSQSAFGRLLGKSQSTVREWLKRELPPEFVLKVEAQTGVSRHDLRPDIYPREGVSPAPGFEDQVASGVEPIR